MLRELGLAIETRHASLPGHHEVRATDVFLRRLHAVLTLAQERVPAEFDELLLTPGLGPRTMQALALVAEVACGAPSRFDDPARFAFAHGGKDGHPHPVPLHVYDRIIETLRSAVARARLGHSDKLDALRRLDARSRELEQGARGGPSFEAIVDDEWRHSPARGGMTVMGPASDALREQVQAGTAMAQRRARVDVAQRTVSHPSVRAKLARPRVQRDDPIQLELFAR